MKLISLLIFTFTMSVFAKPHLITFKSNKSFEETTKEIQNFISIKGLKLFSIIDHKKNAEEAGLKLNNNKLIIFGNPNVGTPLMNTNPEFGIDLPVKILIFTKKNGDTFVSYNNPQKLRSKHSIPKKHPSIVKMTKVLKLLKKKITQ